MEDTMARRTYTTSCVDCAGEITTTYKPPADGVSCGRGPCNAAHNARVAAYQAEVSRRRSEAQRNRRPRAPQPLYGDFAQLAAMHGVATDGTGRKVLEG
jgi:hypothetical protein